MTFRKWLLSQTTRTDGVGILAGVVRDNPPQIVRWGQRDLYVHLQSHLGVSNPLWVALDASRHEFRASERARKAAK